jgi:hypothetical protein
MSRGWRQQDLAEHLDGAFARSTLANVEAGREAPSQRLWAALQAAVPDAIQELEPLYTRCRDALDRKPQHASDLDPLDAGSGANKSNHHLGGPFVIERLRYVYIFRESPSPEEVIETRRLRATRSGADGFGLKDSTIQSGAFRAEAEALWGGAIASEELLATDNRTVYLRRFDFGRKLRRGQVHEFALRSWIERDPNPGTQVIFELTLPADAVTIHLNFLGRSQPRSVGRIGPLADELYSEQEQQPAYEPIPAHAPGRWEADFVKPQLGLTYGLAWQW